MAQFSERMGLVKVALQTDGVDSPLRNSIWNFVSESLGRLLGMSSLLVAEIAVNVLRVPREHVSGGVAARHWLLARFNELPWYTVYEVLEYVVVNPSGLGSRSPAEA